MKFSFAIFAAVIFAGCSVGPNYRQPTAFKSEPLPPAFGEGDSTNQIQWKPAQPAAHRPRGAWWEIFSDAELNRLETFAATNNPGLAAAAARLDQARALSAAARANFFPMLSAQPSFSRQRTSVNAPQSGKAAGSSYTYDNFLAPLELNWEVDLWGRVRRQFESSRARLAASADDLAAAQLALQAEIAADYFTLRSLNAGRAIVADTIKTYRRSLELTQNRRQGGIVTDLDVAQAETQLRVIEAELPALDLQRANLRHALATLAGKPTTGFQIAPPPDAGEIPAPPASLPSELLQRRPDIAAAERRVAAANAEVGVAVGAFYPSIQFNGLAGFQSLDAGTLFNWPSRVWSLGPSLNLPLFTGGLNRAQLAAARAAYDETVANYRATVLTAFQEVEDQLAAENFLAQQLAAQTAAFQSAQHTLDIANNRYNAGLITYLEVATAQSAALQQQRAVVNLQGQQFVTAVNLIKSLGGGWSDSN